MFENFALVYPQGFDADNGSLPHKTQVNVRGYDGIFVVHSSYSMLVAENSYVNFYVLNKIDDKSKGIICPEQFLSKVDEPVEDNSLIPSPFDIGKNSLNGSFGSLKDGQFVKFKFDDRVYKIVASFFMLNSVNGFIICYKLSSLSGDCVFYCPQSFLTRTFEPETIVKDNNSGDNGGGFPPAT